GVKEAKRAYKQIVQVSEISGEEILAGENYPGFPVVPMKNGQDGKSELTGKRNTIDALDLCTYNLVNNVDEGSLIYWVLTNAGGMDDMDDAKFIERLKTVKEANVDVPDGGTNDKPPTIEAPFADTTVTIATLTSKPFNESQSFDS